MLWKSGTHSAYLQRYFLGDVEEVYAVGSRVGTPIYREIIAFLRSSNGIYGVMELSWISSFNEDTLTLYGLKGARKVDTSYFPMQSFDIYKHSIFSSIKELFKMPMNRFLLSVREPRSFHYELIKSYVESIKSDVPPPIHPNEGKETIKLLEAIEKSLETGGMIHL